MISTSNLDQARNLIKKSKEKPIIVEAQNNEFNRKILEYGHFQILLSPEKGQKRDTQKFLDSGLNSILSKIATKNNIAIGINIEEISKLDKKAKAQRLARIKQNIKLCRKAHTEIKALNFKDKIDAMNLLLSLGASTQQAKNALS